MYFLLCLYLYTRWYLVSLPVWFKLKDNGCAVVCDMSLLSRPCLVETIGAAFNRFIGGVRGEQHCLTFATTPFLLPWLQFFMLRWVLCAILDPHSLLKYWIQWQTYWMVDGLGKLGPGQLFEAQLSVFFRRILCLAGMSVHYGSMENN